MPLSDLTADELRAAHATEPDPVKRRAIRRRLAELDHTKPRFPQLPPGWWRDPDIAGAVRTAMGPRPGIEDAARAVDEVARALDKKGKK